MASYAMRYYIAENGEELAMVRPSVDSGGDG